MPVMCGASGTPVRRPRGAAVVAAVAVVVAAQTFTLTVAAAAAPEGKGKVLDKGRATSTAMVRAMAARRSSVRCPAGEPAERAWRGWWEGREGRVVALCPTWTPLCSSARAPSTRWAARTRGRPRQGQGQNKGQHKGQGWEVSMVVCTSAVCLPWPVCSPRAVPPTSRPSSPTTRPWAPPPAPPARPPHSHSRRHSRRHSRSHSPRHSHCCRRGRWLAPGRPR